MQFTRKSETNRFKSAMSPHVSITTSICLSSRSPTILLLLHSAHQWENRKASNGKTRTKFETSREVQQHIWGSCREGRQANAQVHALLAIHSQRNRKSSYQWALAHKANTFRTAIYFKKHSINTVGCESSVPHSSNSVRFDGKSVLSTFPCSIKLLIMSRTSSSRLAR